MKVAVVGLGRIGYEFGLEPNRIQPASHFHCYLKKSLTEIALCDNNPAKMPAVIALPKHYHRSIHLYTDMSKMLDEFQPEIVSICTPTPTHKEIACEVAKCPSVKHIFLEKPIAQSIGEADAIINACGDRVGLSVNYSRYWSAAYYSVKGFMEAQRPLSLIGVHPGPLLRTGSHMIALFNWFVSYELRFGEEFWNKGVEVQAFGSRHLTEYMKNTEDCNINGHIRYGSESSATLLGDLNTGSKTVLFELDVIGRNKRYRITDNGSQIDWYALLNSNRYNQLNEYRNECWMKTDEENLLLKAMDDIILTMTRRDWGETFASSRCSGKDARRTLQIALALHYSAINGNKRVNVRDLPKDYTVKSY